MLCDFWKYTKRLLKRGKNFEILKKELLSKGENNIASQKVRTLKGAIRRSECMGAARFLKLPISHLHFMDLPFYETGTIKKKAPTASDLNNTIALIEEIKPQSDLCCWRLSRPSWDPQNLS